MLLLYDEEDLFPATDGSKAKNFWDRRILLIRYERDDTFNATKMQKKVRDFDGEPEVMVKGKNNKKRKKPWIYRHYVPHSRIIKAIEDCIIDREMTRMQVLQWLIAPPADDKAKRTWKPFDKVFLMTGLSLEPDEFLIATGHPMDSRLAYDTWIDWAVGAICDWPKNIFYGPGKSDGAGTRLDIPTGEKNGAKQYLRVQESAKNLHLALMKKLSLDKVIPRDRWQMSVSKDVEKTKKDMCEMWKKAIGDKDLPWEDSDDEDYNPEDDDDAGDDDEDGAMEDV